MLFHGLEVPIGSKMVSKWSIWGPSWGSWGQLGSNIGKHRAKIGQHRTKWAELDSLDQQIRKKIRKNGVHDWELNVQGLELECYRERHTGWLGGVGGRGGPPM